MPLGPYSPCPCGSGKNFKWCCQPFYGQIEKAFQQQANNQHEAALRTMEQLTTQFPDNPEVWGRRAELLWENDRREEADDCLQKGLELNANYAFGHFLRGMLRHEEGEVVGALLQYRKAADHCDPAAVDMLSEIYAGISQCEMMSNRPVASRAALDIALRCRPDDEKLQERLAGQFGEAGPFPPLAQKSHTFKGLSKSDPRERQQTWQAALAAGETGKLSDAIKVFERLTADNPQDAAAWYNLGLVRAWLGENLTAIEALDAYVREEPDEEQAAAAWALAEVLRFGRDMEDYCDWTEERVEYRIVDAKAFVAGIGQDRRVISVQQRQGLIEGLILERQMPAAHENLALFELPRVAANFAIMTGSLFLMNTDAELLEKGRAIIEELVGPALADPQLVRIPPAYRAAAGFCLPIRLPEGTSTERGKHLIEEGLQQCFEEKWIQRPLRSLNHIPPVDAAGHAGLRRKVLGLIQFQEDLLHAFLPFPYDFDRLRSKLGLPTKKAPTAAGTAVRDLTAMSAAELSTLQSEQLSDEELDRAFQTGQRLDARELAGRFARVLAERPPRADRPDRFAVFHHLIQHALEQDHAAEAMSWVDAGEKHDCEQNEGRRRNDYELRRAQVHLRAQEPERAHEVFDRLIQRIPSNLDILGTATEAMLSARLLPQAAAFAERGLAQARSKGERDRVGYFEELLAAARRQ